MIKIEVRFITRLSVRVRETVSLLKSYTKKLLTGESLLRKTSKN